jgi:hypothetical protein
MPFTAFLLLLFVPSLLYGSSSAAPASPQQQLSSFIFAAAIDSPSCAPPRILPRCISLALRLHSTAPSPPTPFIISHATVTRRLSTLLTAPAVAAAGAHLPPSPSSSYLACITLASSFLSLRLLPLAVQLAHACTVIWPNVAPPDANVKACSESLQQCVSDAITCAASASTQAQHAAHGTVAHKLQKPLCALPALLVYLSIFSRSPPAPAAAVTLGARACVFASLFHCAHLLLTLAGYSSAASAASPCLVTWTSIMSLRLQPPPLPPHMFAPNCIPLLLQLAQGNHGVGGVAMRSLTNLWPPSPPPSPFQKLFWDDATRQLAVMQVASLSPVKHPCVVGEPLWPPTHRAVAGMSEISVAEAASVERLRAGANAHAPVFRS